jgi:hypothetical protein
MRLAHARRTPKNAGHAGDKHWNRLSGRSTGGRPPVGAEIKALVEATPLPPQGGAGHRPLIEGELLAQGQVLEGELAVAAAQEREEPEQVEQEGAHWARFSPDQSRLINHLIPVYFRLHGLVHPHEHSFVPSPVPVERQEGMKR